MVQAVQKTALPLKIILTYSDISENGKAAPFDRYFFDAFLPKICAKWPVSTISIPSAEALPAYPGCLRPLRRQVALSFR